MTLPRKIDGAKVLMYTPLDNRHQATGKTIHMVVGKVLNSVTGLAICQYTNKEDDEDEAGYYLFYCNQAWHTMADTYHHSLAEAQQQAEYEYSGTCATWEEPDSSAP